MQLVNIIFPIACKCAVNAELNCSGVSRKLVFLPSVRVAKNPQLYFARRLHDAMAGGGTDEDTLIRIIVCRSEVKRLIDCLID